jgi:hypothetical protein
MWMSLPLPSVPPSRSPVKVPNLALVHFNPSPHPLLPPTWSDSLCFSEEGWGNIRVLESSGANKFQSVVPDAALQLSCRVCRITSFSGLVTSVPY